MKKQVKAFLAAMAVSSAAFAESTTINYGLTDEYYPSSAMFLMGRLRTPWD